MSSYSETTEYYIKHWRLHEYRVEFVCNRAIRQDLAYLFTDNFQGIGVLTSKDPQVCPKVLAIVRNFSQHKLSHLFVREFFCCYLLEQHLYEQILKQGFWHIDSNTLNQIFGHNYHFLSPLPSSLQKHPRHTHFSLVSGVSSEHLSKLSES